jgi:hypothetical protein
VGEAFGMLWLLLVWRQRVSQKGLLSLQASKASLLTQLSQALLSLGIFLRRARWICSANYIGSEVMTGRLLSLAPATLCAVAGSGFVMPSCKFLRVVMRYWGMEEFLSMMQGYSYLPGHRS